MEVAERRQPLRASEKPLRATGSGQEAASGEPGSIDPGTGENGHRGAERRIVRRSCSRSSMPCMPVVSQAGNQVTWNHFFLWGAWGNPPGDIGEKPPAWAGLRPAGKLKHAPPCVTSAGARSLD